ncbi:hypothetical protein RF11_09354 [Thelohanellus kitauei]|uniref:Uncharacterized protein n=1 Tax=Thelohanellus kitauei TaxID=669202 RepID=A0A0C2MJ97_THEKT|nr:hypothetical protein RF11_09354 [Thelohanellus kitauei]
MQSTGMLYQRHNDNKSGTDPDRKLEKQKDFLRKNNIPQKDAIRASFVVAYNIAKHIKSFCDGEFVKKCMLDVVDNVSSEHRKMFEVSLSRRTEDHLIETID